MSNLAIIPKGSPIGKSLLDRFFVPVLIILSCLLSFGVGRYAQVQGKTEPVTIEEISLPVGAYVVQKEEISQREEGTVVASRNGTKYHLPGCPGAGQIKEENKIWFESSAAAVAAGYSPAANCPGLK